MLIFGSMNILQASSLRTAGPEPGLLFYLSGEKGMEADYAAGDGKPSFLNDVTLVPDGAHGSAFRCSDNSQRFAFNAPGNIYAGQGTLSFFFRPGIPMEKLR